MRLMADVEGGKGPVQFNTQVQRQESGGTISLPSWSVFDTSQLDNNSTSGQFDLLQTWDPTQKLPEQFGQWWQSVYPNHDKVAPMPPLSWSNVDYLALTALTFDKSLLTATDRLLEVQLVGNVNQYFAFLHNPDDCAGCQETHHHLFWIEKQIASYFEWYADLGKIAVQTS
jgi:hypothetical protein